MREKIENWRLRVMGVFFVVLFLSLIGRLFKLQIIDQDYYYSIAKKQYTKTQILPARRGSIYFKDKFGGFSVASKDEILYNIFIIMPILDSQKNTGEKAEDIRRREIEKLLNKKINVESGKFENLISFEKDEEVLLEKDEKKKTELIEKKKNEFLERFVNAGQNQNYFFLGYRVSKDEFLKFEKAGIFENPAYRYQFVSGRIYPKNSTGSHVLGFLNAERKGNYGIEAFADEILKEQKGIVKGEFDRSGRIFTFSKKDELSAKDGADIYLTIDEGLQIGIEKILANGVKKYKAKSGNAIVVHPETGKILAMASFPNFDPNSYFDIENENFFNNTAISDQFETGSTMKPIFVASALDAGVIEYDTKLYDKTGVIEYDYKTGKKKVGGELKIRNALNARYAVQTITEVLQNSSNIGMAMISEKLGSDKAYEYLTNFGFSKKTGIELANETSGSMKQHSKSENGNKWLEVDLATSSFGQGFSVSSIQMAMAGSALANGGKLLSPKIIEKIVDGENEKIIPSNIVRQVISNETSRMISAMMVSVVDNSPSYRKVKIDGYAIGAKSGTGEIVNPQTGSYYRNGPFNNTFLGFGPVYADAPAPILIYIRLEEPEINGSKFVFAESTTAPLFSEMMKFALQYYQIPKNR